VDFVPVSQSCNYQLIICHYKRLLIKVLIFLSSSSDYFFKSEITGASIGSQQNEQKVEKSDKTAN
jgi:hypothetical protein